jgi:hypothetical protein
MNIEVSGGKTHSKLLVTEQMDIFCLFVRTFESATYTKILLTAGSSNHREMDVRSTLGQGGEAVCVTAARKRWEDCN